MVNKKDAKWETRIVNGVARTLPRGMWKMLEEKTEVVGLVT